MTQSATIDALASAAVQIAARGASEYLAAKGLQANPDALRESLRSWVKAKLPEAMNDAREAVACNMGQVAVQTFAASMVQAGIGAAKECAMPQLDRQACEWGRAMDMLTA